MSEPAIWFPTVRAGSGADTFTEQLVQGLQRRGLHAEITWLPHHAEYMPWLVRPPKLPAFANVVHVNTWLPSRFLPRGLPIVATLHHCVQDPAFALYKSAAQKLYQALWITPIEHRIIRLATTVVAVSHYTADCAASIFRNKHFVVIHNGVDTRVFAPPATTATRHPFRLLFVGNHSRRKGFDLLPEIMRRLGPNFELHYSTGRGEANDRFPGNMHALPRMAGAVEMAETYRSADALLFPSRLEGFGLVAAEAMACGLPVIASRCSALPEVIEDDVAGVLCRQDDVDSFVDAIRRLASDGTMRAKMSVAARQRVEDFFALDTMIDRYIGVYLDVLGRRQ